MQFRAVHDCVANLVDHTFKKKYKVDKINFCKVNHQHLTNSVLHISEQAERFNMWSHLQTCNHLLRQSI